MLVPEALAELRDGVLAPEALADWGKGVRKSVDAMVREYPWLGWIDRS